jgi:AAA family ATP:ADP antiporter
MQRRLERAFDLRPGELARGALLFACLFLVIASFTVGKAVRDALFIDEFGALLLPYADIAVALLVGVWISIYLRLSRRIPLRGLLMGSLIFFAANSLVFWYLTVAAPAAWLTPVLYVWVGMFGVIAPAQVWTLANYVVTTREARRLFGFVGSGATAGWIVGGYLTRLAATRFGAEAALLGMAVALVAAALLVREAWARRPVSGDSEPREETGSNGVRHSIGLIAGSPYLLAIAAVILLSSAATAVAGWQFKAISGAEIGGRDELAAFFGTFNFYAGMLSFGLQWVLTGRLLRRAGLGFTLFVVPTALALGTIGLLVFRSLAAAIALRGTDQVLRYAIDKPTVELLYLPVPAEQTLPVKSFIDTIVWRLGDGLAGLAILVFATTLGVGPVGMSWIVLVMLAGWLSAAWVARRQYLVNLRDSIHTYRLDAERAMAAGLERGAADLLAGQLTGSDPAEVLYALRLLATRGRHAGHPAVRGLLQHASAEVRAEAIRVLDAAGDRGAESAIEKLLYDPDLAVRTQALLYVAHHTRVDPLDRIEQLGDFEDFSIRAAMVSFLAQPGPTMNLEAARVLLDRMLADEDPRTRLEAAQLFELLPDEFEEQLRTVLRTGDREQVRAALRAVGRLRKRPLVPRVVERLADSALAADAAAALAAFGDRIVGTLRDLLTDGETPVPIRRELPGVLTHIGSHGAYQALGESLLDADTEVRYRVISALNKLQDLHPGWPLDHRMVETVLGAEITGHLRSYQVLGTLTVALDDPSPVTAPLRDAMERELERIFRLMKLLFPSQDLHSAYVGVQSTNPVVHDNALEFLENVLQPQLRTLLLPLIDSRVPVARRVDLANRVLGARVADETEAVRLLLLSDDGWLQSCGVYAVGVLGLRDLLPALEGLEDAGDPLLRETIRQARARLSGV